MKGTAVNRFSSWEIAKRNGWIAVAELTLILLEALTAGVVWYGLYLERGVEMSARRCGVFLLCYLMVLVLMCRVYDAFEVGVMEVGELAWSLCLAQFFTLAFLYLILSLSLDRLLPPGGFLLLLAVDTVLALLWARLVSALYRALFPARRTYVIAGDAEALRQNEELKKLNWKFELVDFLDIREGAEAVLSRLNDAEAVILVDVRAEERNRVLKYCATHEIQAYIRPRIGDLLMQGGAKLQMLNVPVVHCGCGGQGLTYLLIKRATDILLSGAALILLSPVMAAAAIMIRRYDGGPAFYRQVRLTQGGREFEILKFRSMRMDAEQDGVARLATEHDERITPVGQFLRAYRLDELPQLINILRGEMSLVGPRPERPELAAQYEEELPEFRLRLRAKAGLTGYAQVYGKYNTCPYEKLQMDLLYLAGQSVPLDLKLMFMTVKILFRKESTEGVEEGRTTAIK